MDAVLNLGSHRPSDIPQVYQAPATVSVGPLLSSTTGYLPLRVSYACTFFLALPVSMMKSDKTADIAVVQYRALLTPSWTSVSIVDAL